MTTRAPAASSRPSRRLVIAATLGVAAVVAVAANTVVALAAIAAGASSAFAPLTIAVYAPFTIAGLIAGYIGWRLVRGRARAPHRALTILVPVILVLSFIPDTIAMVVGFIPEGSVTGYVGLMLMHVVVVAVGVPVFARLAPAVRDHA
jgi:hypothetical protein